MTGTVLFAPLIPLPLLLGLAVLAALGLLLVDQAAGRRGAVDLGHDAHAGVQARPALLDDDAGGEEEGEDGNEQDEVDALGYGHRGLGRERTRQASFLTDFPKT